jgi:predicted dienelactone hydrolase
MQTTRSVITLLWMFFGPMLSASAGQFQVKTEVVDLGTLDTGRPAKVTLWYPPGTCTDPAVRFCLADSSVTNKVVVLSHGSMGAAANYSWLGESLAGAGFVVVGVNHYGESSIYGTDTQDPRSTAFTWQRAQDISGLLSKLAGEKLFQRLVDWSNVIAVGHSAGGQTVAMLAGARYDLRRLAAYCESEAGKADLSCNYSRNAGRAPASFVALFDANYQDTRVKKIVLLDPALGSALRQESLRAIAVPALFVGAVHNDFLPWESHGARYASGIPGLQKILESTARPCKTPWRRRSPISSVRTTKPLP